MRGKLRTAAEDIHAALDDPRIKFSFGRRAAGAHCDPPFVKFVPIGGPIGPAKRKAGKTVLGGDGMIEGGPEARLTQPNVDKRLVESVQRETRMLAICIAEPGDDEPDGIDNAEELLEKVVNAAFATYGHEVAMTERWIVQDEEAASLGVAGEAVALTLDFMFPVIRERRPLIRVGGFAQTCKLGDTLE